MTQAPVVSAADRTLMTIVTGLIATGLFGLVVAAFSGAWYLLFQAGRGESGAFTLAVLASFVAAGAFIGVVAAPVIASGLRYRQSRGG